MVLEIFQINCDESDNGAPSRSVSRSAGYVSDAIVSTCDSAGRYSVTIGPRILSGRLTAVRYYQAPLGTTVLTVPFEDFIRLGRPATLDRPEPKSVSY